MHNSAILAIHDFPTVRRDAEWEKNCNEKLRKVLNTNDCDCDFIMRMLVSLTTKINVIKTSFGRDLYPIIFDIMDRYTVSPMKEKNWEFVDCTDDLISEYDQSADMIRLPEGKFVHGPNIRHGKKSYFVINDVIYQVDHCPFPKFKRTKSAKKLRYFPNYPRRKAFSTVEKLIEELNLNCVFNPETGQYGEWYNPNSICDSYHVGGRCADMFLVKDSCQEFAEGEFIFEPDESRTAPEGYRWVSCARKKDIEWEEMRKMADEPPAEYPVKVYSLLTADRAYFKENMRAGSWYEQLHTFLEELSDETVLVAIDYHC